MCIGRCKWAENSCIEKNYHDTQWGVPLHNEQKVFEMLLLEGLQAGLSWRIILQKQTAIKAAFSQFNPYEIVQYTPSEIDELMKNKDIIRNKRKINAIIQNSKSYIHLREAGDTLNSFLWQYVDDTPIKNHFKNEEEVPSFTALSKRISHDLKIKGFSFVGPTIIYSLMQSIGMVNDHTIDCFLYKK